MVAQTPSGIFYVYRARVLCGWTTTAAAYVRAGLRKKSASQPEKNSGALWGNALSRKTTPHAPSGEGRALCTHTLGNVFKQTTVMKFAATFWRMKGLQHCRFHAQYTHTLLMVLYCLILNRDFFLSVPPPDFPISSVCRLCVRQVHLPSGSAGSDYQFARKSNYAGKCRTLTPPFYSN